MDKDAGVELDQGIFLSKVFDHPRAGAHLIHAMRRPTPAAVERLADFRARGEADLGVAHVTTQGKAGVVELRNLRYLNAEDDAAVAALETAVDLVLLDPGLEVGVLRGGVVDHPKHAGRRIFQAGANLTHLYYGQIGLVEFFVARELGYINKMYRGLTGPDFIPDEAETSDEKPWIAAVEAFAIGGGCQITLVCDRVLCEEDAYFSLPARKEGFVPGAANLRLAAIAGERVARQAILFDRAFDARQAEAAGLCDVVVPRGQMDAALDRAIREATEGGAVAVAAQRKALRVGAESIDTFRRYMALYVREQALCMYSDGLIANLQTYWNAPEPRPLRSPVAERDPVLDGARTPKHDAAGATGGDRQGRRTWTPHVLSRDSCRQFLETVKWGRSAMNKLWAALALAGTGLRGQRGRDGGRRRAARRAEAHHRPPSRRARLRHGPRPDRLRGDPGIASQCARGPAQLARGRLRRATHALAPSARRAARPRTKPT